VKGQISSAATQYIEGVKSGTYPAPEQNYP
jgi:ketopantoate hydroxymethyltransferase